MLTSTTTTTTTGTTSLTSLTPSNSEATPTPIAQSTPTVVEPNTPTGMSQSTLNTATIFSTIPSYKTDITSILSTETIPTTTPTTHKTLNPSTTILYSTTTTIPPESPEIKLTTTTTITSTITTISPSLTPSLTPTSSPPPSPYISILTPSLTPTNSPPPSPSPYTSILTPSTSTNTNSTSTQTPTLTPSLTPTNSPPPSPPTPPPSPPTPTLTAETGWPCCETIATPAPIEGSNEETVLPYDWMGCLFSYIGPPEPPWSQDAIDTPEDIFVSDYSWCNTNDIGPLTLGGSTQCSTFAAIRECEARYLIDTCGEPEEHQYIPGDPLQRGYYAKCTEGDSIQCWPISHWKCPDCSGCEPNDPNFIGCLADTATNRDRFGSEKCSFVGRLDGSTPCFVIYDQLRECLKQQCESACEGGCTEVLTGFYTKCSDNNGSPSCKPMGYWVCNECPGIFQQNLQAQAIPTVVDPKTGCRAGTGIFNPNFLDIPLSVVGGGGNPSALTLRIPLSPVTNTNQNQYSNNPTVGVQAEGCCTIRIPSGINELISAGSNYQILNINGQAPYTSGFEVKNIDVTLDQLSSKINIKFDASLFYPEPGYNNNNDKLYVCPPQKFGGPGSPNPCLDCQALDIVRGS